MKKNYLASVLFCLSAITLGCSSGGGGTTTPPPSSLTGTAAAGAPIIGTVTVKGALGMTKSALIEADGTYEVDVNGLTAPYRLRAQGTVGGRTYKLHSYAVAADIGGNVNITPFTDLIVANAASQVAEAFFDSTTQTELDSADLTEQTTELQAKLQNVFNAIGVSGAIDLLRASFSADRSGLDAVLDIVRVEVDTSTNIATITNLIEPQNVITDNLTMVGETETLPVTDPSVLVNAASDIQQIVALFNSLSGSFANGLPSEQAISALISTDFLSEDQNKALFLTDISTDPDLVGIDFSGIAVSNIDSVAGTAEVVFNVVFNGVTDPDPVTWTASKDNTLGWQLRGDQRIADTYFSFHCNDNDGNVGSIGGCGINTQFNDEDFSNNGTNGAPIASGLVSIIDGESGAIKDQFYLGTPVGGTAGNVQVYNEADGSFQGDYRGFGTAAGEIDPAIFTAGDIVEYQLYIADLDISTSTDPMVVGEPVATYRDTLMFGPETVDPSIVNSYPTATAATLTAMQNFTMGSNLAISWTLAADTRNSEVLVVISDSEGNRFELWDQIVGVTATSLNFASSQLSATALSTAGLLDTDEVYYLKVRIYAANIETGQEHSRDYDVQIPGPAAGSGGGSGIACDVSGVISQVAFTDTVTSCPGFSAFVSDDLIGLALEFSTSPGEQFTFTDAANGTFSNNSGATTSPFTWSIDSNGILVISYSDFNITDWIAIYGGDISAGGLLIKAFTDEDNSTFQETWVEIGSLSCGYETPFNGSGAPSEFNNLIDFEALLAGCGKVLAITDADVIGTWVYDFNDGSGMVWTYIYNADGSAVWTETVNGVEQDSQNVTWSISNNRLTLTDVGFPFSEFVALLNDGTQRVLTEDGDLGADQIFDSTRDGYISISNYVKQ